MTSSDRSRELRAARRFVVRGADADYDATIRRVQRPRRSQPRRFVRDGRALSAGNDLAQAAVVARTTSSTTKTTDEHGG
jgi:chromosome condensin MukBEF MukE localization factor